jgi:predicted murein hydrolase (TIGR00659 family)
MIELFKTPAFSVALTLLIFFMAQKLYYKYKFFLFNPVLVSISFIILFLKISGIKYETYYNGSKIISSLLGPSVVALGIPLYLQLDEIKRRGKALLISISVGSVVGILSSALTAKYLGASEKIVASLAPKSVTTPIAMGISESIGGIPPLTAALVITTGIIGAVFGPAILKMLKISSSVAFGLAMGSASHGIGTARAVEEGELEGAVSGLAICLNGVATAVLTPFIMKLILIYL